MPTNFDFVDPAELTGYLRETPTPATWTLNTYLPDEFIGDIDVAWDIVNKTNRAAMFRAYDAETPIGQRDSFERRRVSMPPIGQKTVVKEYERLRLEQVRSGGDNRNRLVEAIYNDAVINTNAVRARMELARGDVLTDWKLTLAGENGLTLEADFGMPAGHNPIPTTAWTDHDDSDPIADMLAWTETYTNSAGEAPAVALTSRTVISHLLLNASLRSYAGATTGGPAILNRQMLDNVFQAYDLPLLRTYDTQIEADGGVATRPIPIDRVLFLPADPRSLGRTFWGVTAEALELASQQNPGLAFTDAPGLAGVVMHDGDPVQIWTKVTGIGMPIITAPQRLLVADVL